MDRFIETLFHIVLPLISNLKSNMDRFIESKSDVLSPATIAFKIQYG